MLGFLPAYLAALIWIKGLSFFEFRFMARMFGWGTVGLTLYLLLPLLAALDEQSGLDFWQALRFELVSEKQALSSIPRVIALVDRKLLQITDEARSGVPFLTFYYLGALCLGYFVGYFLLVFGPSSGKTWQKVRPTTRWVNRMMAGMVWLVVIVAPAGLLYKKLPAIRVNDGSVLQAFVR